MQACRRGKFSGALHYITETIFFCGSNKITEAPWIVLLLKAIINPDFNGVIWPFHQEKKIFLHLNCQSIETVWECRPLFLQLKEKDCLPLWLLNIDGIKMQMAL